MGNKDSIQNIIFVAVSVCLVSAIIVAGSAVSLRPTIQLNKALDKNKNILVAAGLYEKGVTDDAQIPELMTSFDVLLVDLEEKTVLNAEQAMALGIDIAEYDQRKASKIPTMSKELSDAEDIASITRRARYSVVYLLKDGDDIARVVLPVHGYGLWSTLYGFVALQGDLTTVTGITFYDQKETAGLGGEIDNPAWKALWVGKQIYSEDGAVALKVIKGTVDRNSKNAKYQIDGLSGATLTSRGVQNLITYWLGDEGFGPVLKSIKG